jgi:hypothetical protein
MDIRVNDVRFTDKGEQYKVIRLNEDGTLNVEMTSKKGSEPMQFGVTREYYMSLNDVLVHPRVPNKKPGFVGISNCGYSCFMNSVFQSVLTCPPLLSKLLDVRQFFERNLCRNDIIRTFYDVLYLLQSSEGTINIQFFYDAVNDQFPDRDDPSVFLDYIFTNLFNCGVINERSLQTEFFGFRWNKQNEKVLTNESLMAIIEHTPKSCLTIPITEPRLHLQEVINTYKDLIFLQDQQNFIIIHPDNGRADGVPTILPINGKIRINNDEFRVCSIIVRVGTGHYYTVTWHGRFDDDNVEENSQFMINLLENGFDQQTSPVNRQNNGCFYFFERVQREQGRQEGREGSAQGRQGSAQGRQGRQGRHGSAQERKDTELAKKLSEELKRIDQERRDAKLAQELSDEQMAQSIEEQERRDAKFAQELSDEQMARSIQDQGSRGGANYKKKYLKYKNKYLLLKKKINS